MLQRFGEIKPQLFFTKLATRLDINQIDAFVISLKIKTSFKVSHDNKFD